jgi:hypothetical protein
MSNEMGAEARKTVQDLMLIPQRKNIEQNLSLKKKREMTAKTLLTMQGIKHGEKCTRCELNCQVKHDESMTFWARQDGIKPLYDLGNCPKQGKLEKLNIKKKRRVK